MSSLKYTSLGELNKCGTVSTSAGSVTCCRAKSRRATQFSNKSLLIPPLTPEDPIIPDPNFSGDTNPCTGTYPLNTSLDTASTILDSSFQTLITKIKNTAGAKIDIDQRFFDNMDTNSTTLNNQLVHSTGTLIVKDNKNVNNGYIHLNLTGNITFNPEPLQVAGKFYDQPIIDVSSQQELVVLGSTKRLGYTLGWFTAIAIENQQGTVISLNGNTLKQSKLHNLQQRFYSNIELASSPFDHPQGPATFAPAKPAQNVFIIGPGTIGLSSHHSVHGNGHKEPDGTLTPIENILFENITFENYEIAGLHLNGFKNVIVKNCHFKSQRIDVPVRGTLSAANFLKPYINALADMSANALYRYGDLGEKTYSYYKDKLQTAVDAAYNGILGNDSANWNDTNATNKFWYKLFANEVGGEITQGSGELKVTDGVAYGIVGNAWGVAVNGFPTTYNDILKSENLYIHDTQVENVLSSAIEVPGVSPPASDASANFPFYPTPDSIVITHDPAGAVMSPFQSYNKYTNGTFSQEFLNLVPLECSEGRVTSNKSSFLKDLQTYLPFVKPRVDTGEQFNVLLACQLLVAKNIDLIKAKYDANPTANFRLKDVSRAKYNKAYNEWMTGKTVNDTNGNWCTPYSTISVERDRNYDNSFRSSFHYLTGLSSYNQSKDTLVSTPFSSWEMLQLSDTFHNITWDKVQNSSTAKNSKITTGHDFMAHISKPAIGLKLDGIKNVLVSKTNLKNICQFGRPGSNWNGKYEFGQPQSVYSASTSQRLKGYNGASVEGITLSSSHYVSIYDIKLQNLHSSFSDLTGINSLWEASFNRLEKITSSSLTSGIHYVNNTKIDTTIDLYTYNPTPAACMVVYKKSDTAKSLEYCSLDKPSSFYITPARKIPANLLLTKQVAPPNTW